MDAVERVERRLIALEQLFHSESKMFADQDGMWTIPMLRSEVLSLARSNGWQDIDLLALKDKMTVLIVAWEDGGDEAYALAEAILDLPEFAALRTKVGD